MTFVELARQAIFLAATLSVPVLAAGLAAGVLTGFLGAALRLHDGTLAALPRQVAVGVVLVLLGTTGFTALLRFTELTWRSIPTLVP